ncbi:MAG TPA: hypothetical protein VGB52_11135 [Actinomycetota bacterium]
MNVLIVSRREQTRAWVRSALGPDFPAEDADDGLAALARARAGGIDLVVADETSEPYGAFGLCRELKLLPDAPGVIVQLERAQDVWLAGWSGADRWFVQPVDPFELAAAAREVTVARGGESSTEPGVDGAVGDIIEQVAG